MTKGEVVQSFSFFEDRVIYYAQYFGLLHKRVDVSFEATEEPGNAATCMNGEAQIVNITLNSVWIKEGNPDKLTLDKVAFHEIMEALLMELRLFSMEAVSEACVDDEVHRIIRTLENAVWPMIRWHK